MEDMDVRGRKALGAKIVARAWVDPAFKGRLLDNAAAAAEELGITSSNFPPAPGATLRVASETEGAGLRGHLEERRTKQHCGSLFLSCPSGLRMCTHWKAGIT